MTNESESWRELGMKLAIMPEMSKQQKRAAERRRVKKEKKDPSDAFDEMAAAASGLWP